MSKCSAITSDIWGSPSIINKLATANQLLAETKRDADGSIISKRKLDIIGNIVALARKDVKDKYNIDNITYDDYTACKSALQATDSNGNYIYDSSGSPVYYNITRDDLSELGYRPHYKYFAKWNKILPVLKPLTVYIPIHYDIYAPPVIFVVVFLLLVLTACILNLPKLKRIFVNVYNANPKSATN